MLKKTQTIINSLKTKKETRPELLLGKRVETDIKTKVRTSKNNQLRDLISLNKKMRVRIKRVERGLTGTKLVLRRKVET